MNPYGALNLHIQEILKKYPHSMIELNRIARQAGMSSAKVSRIITTLTTDKLVTSTVEGGEIMVRWIGSADV
jgi:DNA-binding IclR family transcriptional regulator